VAAATGTFLAVQFGHPGLPWEQNASPSGQNSDTHHKGAENPPPLGEGHASSSSQTEADQTEKDRREHAANERGLTEYTGHLAIFTLLLVLIAGVQASLFVWQLWLMREGVRDASDAAKAAQKAADATLLHARAAVAAEISELFVPQILLVIFPDQPPGVPDPIVSPGQIPPHVNQMRVVLTVVNAGRTRARMRELCVEWQIIDRTHSDRNPDPVDEPVYTNKIGTSHIFDKDQTLPLKWSGVQNGVISLTQEQKTALNTNQAWLWVYGCIVYSDFLADEYDLGFVGHWEATPGATIGTPNLPVARGFVMEGPPAYIYRRKRERPPQT
jgi:hypothetical protein